MLYPLLILTFVALCYSVSAYTYLNIYVDNTGKAEFLGETNATNNTLNLPQGVSVSNGQIRGTTSTLTTKSGDLWTFTYTLLNSEIKVILPEGSVTDNIANGEVSLERERISVYFQNNAFVRYSIGPVPTSNTLTIIIFLLVLVAVLAYIFRHKIFSIIKPRVIYKKSKSKGKGENSIKHMLNDRENLILEKLKQTGKIKMSHLRKLSEIPKASFSRHVQQLEKKKLLVRSGEGKNKFVELSKKGI